MSTLSGPPETIAAIGVAAGRIRRYCEAIAQGHDFGIGQGQHNELWSIEYQRDATPIYAETIPWDYLHDLAASFDRIAGQMLVLSVPQETVQAWDMVHRYLRSATTALTEAAPQPVLKIATDEAVPIIEPVTPPLMRFGKLAAITNSEGTAALLDAARQVEHACGKDDRNPLTEQEKAWIHRLIAGDRVADISTNDGYSERSMYRALSDLWDRLGVRNRTEAIAHVIDNQWLD